ncbi:HK97-gp10 family putative phage morphogenesis protein [Clostridium intestinale]|uniref:HK97-gp10 family putative phage morphogenesis protein n=1 Tax=Clostridium intestinale TaxID=36845 RepID=UPI002DD682A3|nr:HK97-gp10 family putative phage morphogenesis protein [Clostridium intestinale]WRY53118.1 HK97 gp10 family phage protein [Clostridium intestinale]
MSISSINVSGFDSILKKLDSLGVSFEEVIVDSVKKETKRVKDDARDVAPVDKEDLKKSITEKVEVTDEGVTGTVSTNSDHAAYVEFGTGKTGETTPVEDKYPGALSYKQDKWLVNIPDVGYRWIEGQMAQPYLYPALKNNKEKIVDNIKKDLNETIRRVAKE